jgi:hypothetical protein
MTEGLSKELEYCQQAVQPLLAALQRTTAALPAAANAGGDAAQLRVLLSSARLACRVFYSLNSPGLTEASGINPGASLPTSTSGVGLVISRTLCMVPAV